VGLEENKAGVRRYFEAGVNAQDPAVVEALVHPDVVLHYGERTVRGREAYLRGNAAAARAFADWRVTVEAVVAEGDLVAVRGTIRATHHGPFDAGPQGIVPPTGAAVALTQQALVRVQAGRLIEAWVERDGLSLLRQLGALPAAPAGESPDVAQTASLEHEATSAPSLLPEVDTA
jgi:predicted ester cyclase